MDFGLLETLANRRGRKESPHSKTATLIGAKLR